MLIAWVATVYGLWQLIELHEIKGRRFNRYHELGQYALGKFQLPSRHLPHNLANRNILLLTLNEDNNFAEA